MATDNDERKYTICFKECNDTMVSVFGEDPITPSEMTKKMWEYVKYHTVTTGGEKDDPAE